MADEKKPKKASKPKKTTAEKVAAASSGGVREIVKKIALGAVSVVIADIKDKAERKKTANKVQPKWSPKGSLYNLPEDSDRFQKLRQLAKASGHDIAAGKKTAAVQAFFDAMAEHGTGGGGGGLRDRSEAAGLADLL